MSAAIAVLNAELPGPTTGTRTNRRPKTRTRAGVSAYGIAARQFSRSMVQPIEIASRADVVVYVSAGVTNVATTSMANIRITNTTTVMTGSGPVSGRRKIAARRNGAAMRASLKKGFAYRRVARQISAREK